jgi:O-antigen/teichoic acid export membrane protein
MIYNQIDSVMLGYQNQITETGWYNASYGIAGAVLLFSGFISLSFYPALSKYFKESREMLQKVWDSQMDIMIFLAVPLMVGGVALGPQIINFIYGSDYLPATLSFQILIVMAGITYLQSPFNRILIAVNQQKKLFWATLFGAAVNVILNLILIPRFSLNGSALATVFTWLVLLVSCVIFTYRYTPIKIINLRFVWVAALSIFSAFIMYLAILNAKAFHLHLLFSILIGFVVYLGAFFALRFITNKLKYVYARK